MLVNIATHFACFVAGGIIGLGAMAFCVASGEVSRREEEWERQAGIKANEASARQGTR